MLDNIMTCLFCPSSFQNIVTKNISLCRWLQARVLFCLLLLGAGRGINVLVPLQYKKIGKRLFPGSKRELAS